MFVPGLNSVVLLSAWEEGVSQPLMQRALTLLAVTRPERSAEEWARLSIGERDRWLLQVREELFGASLEMMAVCPKCSERLELSFNTSDVRVSAPAAVLENGLVVGASGYEVTCHLPTSADLLDIIQSPAPDLREALLKRCVEVARLGGESLDPAALPDEIVSTVIDKMAKADPQADVQVEMACPACSHRWSLPFDILSYLWSEIEDWAQRLLLDVHTLASAYGWSEGDILTMSPRRRRIYLEMTGP